MAYPLASGLLLRNENPSRVVESVHAKVLLPHAEKAK